MVFRRLVAPAVVLCLLGAGCAPSSPGAPPLPGSGRHRVQASGAAADALLASGATLVADYGAFRVLDASPPALQGAAAAGRVELRDDFLRIALNSGDLDTSRAAPKRALGPPTVGADGKALHLLQFAGPIRPEWLARLDATGVRVVTHVPANAYLVYGDAAALERLRVFSSASPEVQFEDAYLPAQKLDRALASSGQGSYAVQLVEDPAVNSGTLALAERLAREPGRTSRALGYVNLVVHADRAAAEALAARPDVVSVQPWEEPHLRDERQDVILSGQLTGGLPSGPGYLAWLAAKGFTQAQFDVSGFGVDVSDSGIDNGTTLPNHFGLYRAGDVAGASRVGYARLEGTPHGGSTIEGCDGHGTVNAHIVAGFSDRTGAPFADPQGFRYGLGVAPFVRVGSSVVFDPSVFTSPVFEDLMSRAWADGMRISSNSWGANTPSYTSACQRYDALVRDAAPAASALPLPGNQEMTIVFAAGNSGPYAGTIGSPGSAKNVLSAGASENVHPFAGADRCGTADTGADQALDVASFSSRGPAADGRTRPDLLAPGTHVTGGVAQAPGQRAEPPAVAAGQANACFGGGGVCGGVGSPFFPAGQQWYTASSGTSHSTPAIAGAAALVRQWFLNGGLPAPSPAMTKAFLVSSARYMTGAGANDNLFSNGQGMGLLDLGTAFDGTPRLLRDQEAADLFTATGQTRTFTSAVGDGSKPFRVTLVWTDAPGSTLGSAWNNDLDLTVEVGGQVYRGNVFSGGTSVAGGSADFRNNVESVFLPPGTTGTFTVTVTAANVTSDGVPGNGTALDQDFALVVSNSCADPAPPAPLDVAAAATAPNEITVSWTPNGAGSYLVYRAQAATGPWERVATLAAPPYADAGRSGGLTFFYVVRAQQGCAVSVPSAEASATATGACLLPPAFGGLATAGTTGDAVCGNVLAWAAATPSCGGTIAYDVFRSVTSGFAPAPENRIATGVGGLSYVDSVGVAGGTTYHYVARAIETSAGTVVDDGNVVQRSAAPYVVSTPVADDFDGNRPPTPAAWWVERALAGADQLTLTQGCRWQSATSAYRFGQATPACNGTYAGSVQNLLVLGGDGSASSTVNGIVVPAGSGTTLTFRIWYALETGWDGAYLVWSSTGANGTFTPIEDTPSSTAPYIASGGYNGTFYAGGRRGWTGNSTAANGAWKEVVVRLDALAGQKIWLGWRFGSDSVIAYEGFYLDDVRLELRDPACTSCAIAPPAAPTGASAASSAANELTVSWTANGASAYEVRRATSPGGPYTLAGTVAGPPFVDAGRSGGTTYHYVIRAREGCALSPASAEVSATATGPCLLEPTFAGAASAATSGSLVCGNVVSWAAASPSCGGTLAYDVFRSTQAGFAPAPANLIATGLTGTSFADSGDLVGGTAYHYVVRAVETSAGGAVADVNVVERTATPGWTAFRDDFDANRPPDAAGWWLERTELGGDQLQVVSGCRWQSPSAAYRFGNSVPSCGWFYPSSTRNVLVLGGDGTAGPDGIDVPASGGATLSFRLWYDFGSYDGAYLVWSGTGASGTFTPVEDAFATGAPYIVSGGYDGSFYATGRRGWTGNGTASNGAWKSVVVNLDALAGKTAWFGWTFATSYLYVGREGLYLDDVEARAACSTTSAPGAAVRYRITGLPSQIAADAPATLTITALDAWGRVADGYGGTAALSSTDPAGVLPASLTFTAGVASLTARFRTAGARSLAATDGAIQGGASTTVEPGPDAELRLTAQPPTAAAGPFLPAVQITVADAFGNRTSSAAVVTLSLGANPRGDTLQGTTTVSAVSGVATFGGVYLQYAAEGYTLVASATGLTSVESSPFAVVAGPPAALTFTQEPAAAVAGEVLSPAPVVEVRDAYGNVATQSAAVVSLALSYGPTGAVLAGTLTRPSVNGVATFDDLAVNRSGPEPYALVASTGVLPSAAGTPFTAVAGPPHRVIFVDQPGSGRAGVPLLPAASALVLDRFDNPALASTTSVSLSFASNPSLARLLGQTTALPASGHVVFPGVAIDRAGAAFALYVGAAGLVGDTSVGLDVLPGPVTRYELSGPATAPEGAEITYTASARDALGNEVLEYVGTAIVTSSDPTAELPPPVSFPGARIEGVRVTFRTAGAQTLTFTESSGVAAGALSVTVTGQGGGGGGGGGCHCGNAGAGGGLTLLALAALLRRRRRREGL